MLKVSKLSKRFADKWVLREVSFTAETGKILGIIGESSGGKSVILQIIQGTEKQNSGEILLGEKNLSESKERGFVFCDQQFAKGWKSIFSSKTTSDTQSRLAFLRQQLDSAKSVILLDNPCQGLNNETKEQFLDELRKQVSERQLIAVFVSNSEEEVFSTCDQVAVLNDGYIVQTGTPREIYEKPNCVASAKALGRCNLLVSRRVTFNNQNSLEFQTLRGDHRLLLDKVEKSSLGAITNNVSLAIRPEHISISFGASFPEDNLLKAKIENIKYLGATTRLYLNADELILEALVLRLVGLNRGDECMVGLPPDRILVLKD